MELTAALLVVLVGFVAGKGLTPGIEHKLTLDPEEKFNVSWSFKENTSSSYITITITCRTSGWVGLGLSPNGAMTGSDIVVAWVADDASVHLLDMHATSSGAPILDVSQDAILISAEESNGVTTVKYKRKMDTCDVDGDNIITSSTTRLIYAYHDTDPTDGDSFGTANYHGSNKGVRSLYLLEAKNQDMSKLIPNDALNFDVRVRSYNMPAVETVYYCSFHEPPQLDTKHHIVAVEPLITEGNLGLVHHIILYGCMGLDREQIERNNITEGVCFNAEMPEFADSCNVVVHGWAVGGGIFYYPEEAGYPIGGGAAGSPDYYQMEVHYDNPALLDTFIDSSGLRLIYTPTHRQHDSGSLGLGMVEGVVVPPRVDNFRTIAFCDSTCTSQWIPDEGVELYGYLLHTHLIGTAIQVDWFRDGQQIGVLAYDDSYDFNFQHTRHLEKNRKLMPGDTMKVTCTYSSPRDTITYGGLATVDEMCLAYLFYYPNQELGACASVPSMMHNPEDPVYNSLSVNASQRGVYAFADVSVWNDEAVDALQGAYDNSPHTSLCYNDRYQAYDTNRHPIDPTAHMSGQREPEDHCVEIVPTVTETGTRASSAPMRALHSIHIFLLAVLFAVAL